MSTDKQTDNNPFLPGKVFSFALLLLLLFALYLAARIFYPFLDAIVLAIIIAALSRPLYERLLRLLRGHSIIASLIFIFLFVMCLIIPITFFAVSLSKEAVSAVNTLQVWAAEFNLQESNNDFIASISAFLDRLNEFFPGIDLSHDSIKETIENIAGDIGAISLTIGKSMLGNTLTVVVNFLLMLLVLFFLLNDGAHYFFKFKYMLPIEEGRVNTIVANLSGVAKSILLGGFVVALLQGVTGGLGMYFVGLPGLFWGSMMGFVSFIPVIGTAVIWIPAVGYLLASGQIGAAIFLFLWSAVVVSGIDTVVRPYIMKGASGISPVLTLLSILGGIRVFGAIGLMYGPLILMFAVTLIRICREDFSTVFNRGKSQATLEQGGPEA